jgi:hypothetical protein
VMYSVMVRREDTVMPEITFVEAVPDFYYSAVIPNAPGLCITAVVNPIIIPTTYKWLVPLRRNY